MWKAECHMQRKHTCIWQYCWRPRLTSSHFTQKFKGFVKTKTQQNWRTSKNISGISWTRNSYVLFNKFEMVFKSTTTESIKVNSSNQLGKQIIIILQILNTMKTKQCKLFKRKIWRYLRKDASLWKEFIFIILVKMVGLLLLAISQQMFFLSKRHQTYFT